MNTNRLKKFASEARIKITSQVQSKLNYVLSTDSPELREKQNEINILKKEIESSSKQQVVDKVAYTWFNRIMALRFMDVNGYQPLGINIVSPVDGESLPEILAEAKQGIIPDDLKELNPKLETRVMDILDSRVPSNNPQNEVYKYLLIATCNHLSSSLPFLFEHINDYTELLLPDDLTSESSIVSDIHEGMLKEECEQVEIIGWLYQFYISERKDEVFALKSKVCKEDIPAATQLFTPRWIVEYMVQNTLGKLWLQNKPKSQLRDVMPYYIENASSSNTDFLKVNSVEEISFLDQACGSGHILVYAFELFTKIYEEEGYNSSEIPKFIIENNLFGFEIDDRAAQLSAFAIMMKARSYNRRIFRKKVCPNILCYQDLHADDDELSQIFSQVGIKFSDDLKSDLNNMRQATNLGSLIIPNTSKYDLEKIFDTVKNKADHSNVFLFEKIKQLICSLEHLILLSDKYSCVVDNPPYMGGGNMNKELSAFVKKNYPDSKADLMACFMEAGLLMLKDNGYLGMINQHSWMFLSSYEALRKKLIENAFVDTLLHLGPRTFPEIGGEVVQNASFTICNTKSENKGSYIRLVDYDKSDIKREKTLEAIRDPDCGWFFTANQKDFEKITGNPIGYWLSQKMIDLFASNKRLGEVGEGRQGLATADNGRFLRLWSELSQDGYALGIKNLEESKLSNKKWFPCNKGGEKRKWYGNQEYMINWEDDGYEIRNFKDDKGKLRSVVRNPSFYFRESISWGKITSGGCSFRYYGSNFIFDNAGMCLFINRDIHVLGFLNTKVYSEIAKLLNPTINLQVGDVVNMPYSAFENIDFETIVEECINTSQNEWDSREISWDFKRNELLNYEIPTTEERLNNINQISLKNAYKEYKKEWTDKFFQLHKNEEELNRIFIDIYGLQDEITPDVPLKDITILKEETDIIDGELVFDKKEILAQFISYAVGCMFGRYSLDKEGLILANQGEYLEDYLKKIEKERARFLPDDDNIIPILDDEWFEDDIVAGFKEFLKISFGKEQYDKNIAFVEEAIGKDIRKYFIKDFYADHIKRYKKRPIYWMFSSPSGSFNVLIYMHRYTPDTVNDILNKYLREYQVKLKNRTEHLNHILETTSGKEAIQASKEKDKITKILLELQVYERDVIYPLATDRIDIDLDDGVLVNYNKFGSAIKKVAGLNDAKTKKKVRAFDWIDIEEIRD